MIGFPLPAHLEHLAPGMRIRTTAPLPEEKASPPIGSTATVVAVRPEIGQVLVDWDHRCSLILLTSDPFAIIDQEEPR